MRPQYRIAPSGRPWSLAPSRGDKPLIRFRGMRAKGERGGTIRMTDQGAAR
jgi:hypothetical protein